MPQMYILAEVAKDICIIFNAPERTTTEAYLARTVQKYQKTAPRLAEWMATNILEGLAVYAFQAAHRRWLRTTNGVGRLHRDAGRRARLVSIFPNPPSCLRLGSAILIEIREEWLKGRT